MLCPTNLVAFLQLHHTTFVSQTSDQANTYTADSISLAKCIVWYDGHAAS